MRLVVIILSAVIFTLCFFLFQKGNRVKISNNQGTTQGTVTKVFFRGKLPFCEFHYQVDEKNYTKTQELSKSNSKKVLHQTFTVLYEKDNPINAVIKFNKKESPN